MCPRQYCDLHISIDEETTSALCYLGYALAHAGKRSEAQAILDKLKNTKGYVSPAELAVLYVGLGDKEGGWPRSKERMSRTIYKCYSSKLIPTV